jgi:hypothetical protein
VFCIIFSTWNVNVIMSRKVWSCAVSCKVNIREEAEYNCSEKFIVNVPFLRYKEWKKCYLSKELMSSSHDHVMSYTLAY